MMKKICVVGISLMILFLLNMPAMAQKLINGVPQTTIHSVPLSVTFSKTTNLIFPYAIKSVDVGSREVLAQYAKGVENILQVKAAKQGFSETNLTVLTSDGTLYSFILNYMDNPIVLNIKIGQNNNQQRADALFSARSDNEAQISDLTQKVAQKKPIFKRIKTERFGVSVRLSGIYIKGDRLYFHLALENKTNIDYAIENLQFFIKDNKGAKRTASQEIYLEPLQIAGNVEVVAGRSDQSIAIALKKFTIPDKKVLFLQIMEANGGRHLTLKVKNQSLLKAVPIN